VHARTRRLRINSGDRGVRSCQGLAERIYHSTWRSTLSDPSRTLFECLLVPRDNLTGLGRCYAGQASSIRPKHRIHVAPHILHEFQHQGERRQRAAVPWIRQYVTNRNHVALAKTSGICPPQKLGGSAFGFGFFLLANVEENGTERPKFWNACWRHAGQAGVASYPTYGEERPGGGIWPPAARLMVRFEGHISRLARRERRCFRTDVQ
jgi:hypothetical protein